MLVLCGSVPHAASNGYVKLLVHVYERCAVTNLFVVPQPNSYSLSHDYGIFLCSLEGFLETWPADTPVMEKVCGPVENLQRTAAYV